jgi:dipeptidyl aminopeptidase/acylaminoacyl peptidase
MDKITWNEQWMGYPVGPQYAASSNIDNAYRLQGHLQLVLGEQDNNVPPESTFRLVDALNRANKDFEFVFIPGADHGAGIQGENVVQNKLQDFFVRYLLHQDPPERNSQPARAGRGG